MRVIAFRTFVAGAALAGLTACEPRKDPAKPADSASGSPAHAGDAIIPQTIATAGFPADSSVILRWIHDEKGPDTTAIRAHAWALWAGVTAMTEQVANGAKLPVYETWPSRYEVFELGQFDTVIVASGRDEGNRGIHQPVQFNHDALAKAGKTLGSGARTIASVKYNADAVAHVRRHRYNDSTTLRRMNDSLPASTPIEKRGIIGFPSSAVVVKAVYWNVKRDGLTLMPYWAGTAGSTNPAEPAPNTWKQFVLVDPSGKLAGTTREVTHDGRKVSARVVGLDRFYSFPMDADEIAAVRGSLAGNAAIPVDLDGVTKGDTLEVGDHAILVGMHVVTKEIPNWTWQTFWWTPDPANDPLARDAPADIKAPFNSFAMQPAYYSNVFNGPEKDRELVAMNPYLETDMPGGVTSNCMSCHHTAAWPTNLYVFSGRVRRSDPRLFAGKLKTDMLWSIQVGDSLQLAARLPAKAR